MVFLLRISEIKRVVLAFAFVIRRPNVQPKSYFQKNISKLILGHWDLRHSGRERELRTRFPLSSLGRDEERGFFTNPLLT